VTVIGIDLCICVINMWILSVLKVISAGYGGNSIKSNLSKSVDWLRS
jgi:hypothetical protein